MAKAGRYQIWVDGCPTNNTNNDLTKVIDLAHRLHLIAKKQYQVRGPGGVVVWTSEEKGGQS